MGSKEGLQGGPLTCSERSILCCGLGLTCPEAGRGQKSILKHTTERLRLSGAPEGFREGRRGGVGFREDATHAYGGPPTTDVCQKGGHEGWAEPDQPNLGGVE